MTPLLSIYGQVAADFHERERQRKRGVGGGHGGRTGAHIDAMDEISFSSSSPSSLSSSAAGGLKTVVLIWVVRELALFELLAADVS